MGFSAAKSGALLWLVFRKDTCGICCGLTISERLGTKFIANGKYAYLMASVTQNLKASIFSIANSLLERTSVTLVVSAIFFCSKCDAGSLCYCLYLSKENF